MWIRIASKYLFAVIDEPLLYYRQVPTSISKNCKVMEKSFQSLIEKVFESAPSNLQYLKNRSYGYAYVCLAWKALQSNNKDHKLAASFQQQALTSYPKFRFSKETIRLSLAIALMRGFGTDGYAKALNVAYKLRRFLSLKSRLSSAKE